MKNALRNRSGSTMNFTFLFYDQVLGEPFSQLHTNYPMKEPIKYSLLDTKILRTQTGSSKGVRKINDLFNACFMVMFAVFIIIF